ncbi:tRNA (guanosine(46)-N7)-methyltransferase TrmB [Salipaludibacillus keqinensis]|uniref:tRNA (guanine-N(7)-)-methyltransferase n=1 Tax=Salipaludibacillus keqinensis TaxID=2045207 RepID=A0A323TG48_9BACI|nr:tRNA (guanosine(46)-N7)-methyltransferase TrmB [Salipaludibacillus keqinensis]PYZ93798.1 tRNA (guanosine(46)-N7)-methyltransferase TrmB [Salipaludibacillus keqinensis]
MRLRNKPWAAELIENHPEVVESDPQKWKGKWTERFEKTSPLFVEVGTGKGQFVSRMAAAYPNTNFIGVEKYESVLVTGVQRVIEEPKSNLLFLQEDVHNITDFFSEGEVDRLYINFTDPWPKNKHAKRRLTHESFLKKYDEILTDTGEIHFKTDNQGLFEYSLKSFTHYGLKLKNVSLDLHSSDMEDNIMTEYEEKFSSKGMRIFRVEAYR